jgi:hypothetical protein
MMNKDILIPLLAGFVMMCQANAQLLVHPDAAARKDFNTPYHTGALEPILNKSAFKHYIDQFNLEDTVELHVDVVPGTRMIRNADAWSFLEQNIPFFECPDREIEEVYYYRWWTFRKHIKETPGGYVITEFMPTVSWAGKYNSISCPAMHHFREGRWLHDPRFMRDYGLFWLRGGAAIRRGTAFR